MYGPPRGLALGGSIVAIVVGALMLLGGIGLIAQGGRYGDVLVPIGAVVAMLGVAAVVLGGLGCAMKPGPILANAIIFTVMTVLGFIGLAMNPNIFGVIGLLLYGTAMGLCYPGYKQAVAYREHLTRDVADQF